jgi:hypothetical protein
MGLHWPWPLNDPRRQMVRHNIALRKRAAFFAI